MDLQPYIERVRHELSVAAAPGGAEAAALADRLSAALDSALRLALLEALSEAAEQVTRDLAPDSVEVRLRGRDPEFIVSAAAREPGPPPAASEAAAAPEPDDEGGTWRVTFRLPAGLRTPVETAAGREGLSVNAWLVRAVSATLRGDDATRDRRSTGRHVSGWVR
ncbi:histidine kinase [Mycobacterium sp. PS03-16]|uniref:histidine kinase n=1 Tax=Mycobacterium sp. PS03-16 TaxID=2559611 RepID=UPI001073218E|nr:histidine kinase [Mycobacterium sp. PS03-16]TFV54526.1 histidine kinase [Mycobacterium sp. PS03-16]